MTREDQREEERRWTVIVASICGAGILSLGILMMLWWALHREDRVASVMEIHGEDAVQGGVQ